MPLHISAAPLDGHMIGVALCMGTKSVLPVSNGDLIGGKMDIIDRLKDDEMCVDAIDDAITIIESLRATYRFGGYVLTGPELIEIAARSLDSTGMPGAEYLTNALRAKAANERALLARLGE